MSYGSCIPTARSIHGAYRRHNNCKNCNICIPTKLVDFPASSLSESNAKKVKVVVFQHDGRFPGEFVELK